MHRRRLPRRRMGRIRSAWRFCTGSPPAITSSRLDTSSDIIPSVKPEKRPEHTSRAIIARNWCQAISVAGSITRATHAATHVDALEHAVLHEDMWSVDGPATGEKERSEKERFDFDL